MSSDGLQPETLRFLKDLGENNSRDWFAANKADYQRFIRKPADAFRDRMTGDLGAQTGRELASRQFRINRDLRFSKDKTPYNTHIRMAFWPKGAVFEGKDAQPPSFFLSIEPDHIRIGAGCMAFSKPVLAAYLQALESGDGDRIVSCLAEVETQGFGKGEPDLARPAKGFPAGHPHADLARHKGLAVWKTLEDTRAALGETGPAWLATQWQPVLPLWRTLAELHENA